MRTARFRFEAVRTVPKWNEPSGNNLAPLFHDAFFNQDRPLDKTIASAFYFNLLAGRDRRHRLSLFWFKIALDDTPAFVGDQAHHGTVSEHLNIIDATIYSDHLPSKPSVSRNDVFDVCCVKGVSRNIDSGLL